MEEGLFPIEVRIMAKELKSASPTVMACFPGIGLVSTIVSSYLIQEMKPDSIGFIESRWLPPIVAMQEGVAIPPVRIYEKEDLGLVIIHSDVPILPGAVFDFGLSIVEWVSKVKVSEVVSIAGVATMSEETRVFGAASDEKTLLKIKDVVEIFRFGTISGLAGTLLTECASRDIPALTLLGETRGTNPDPRSAAEVIKTLNNIYGWEISVEKLLEEAERIEAEMHRLAQQMKQQERPERKEFPMYG
jgi:uncharacterized protein